MIKISNHTKTDINIFNENFSINLPSKDSIEIENDFLHKNTNIYIRYSGFDASFEEIKKGFEKGGLRKHIFFRIEKQIHFPIITNLNVKNNSEIILERENISLRKIMLFKTICLEKIICRCNADEIENVQYNFSSLKEKNRFLKMISTANIIAFPALIFAILAIIVEVFSDDDFISKLTILFFLVGFTIVILEDFYYGFKAKKWGIVEKTGDGSVS